jgi:hypothetical protein
MMGAPNVPQYASNLQEVAATAHPTVLWPFPWFTTPNTPDLGCFVRSEHGFQVDSNSFLWLEFAPWEVQNGALVFLPHQVYVRIKCGEAAFFQRTRAWMAPYGSNPIPLLGTPPDHVLGGNQRPYASDWVKFPVQSGPKDYWFAGEHRDPTQASWQGNASVGHSFDRYDNGTLSTVGWDDTGGDLDYDDLTMEVAVVYRRSYFDFLEPVFTTEARSERFVREELPKYQASDKLPPSVRKAY